MLKKNSGFTMVEVLVAVLISVIVMTAIWSTFQIQQRSYAAQEHVAAMQQNLRAGMHLMANDIRIAGYDPKPSRNFGITNMGSDTITFTMDIDGDGAAGGSGEEVTYTLWTDTDGRKKLVRKAPTTPQAVSENIEALNFIYLNASGGIAVSASEVRSVQITMVARADRYSYDHTESKIYRNLRGDPVLTTSGDTYRHRLLAAEVECRNLGF
jgi:prepilin-type N-terminal cleavage/methylation domain-containing protein